MHAADSEVTTSQGFFDTPDSTALEERRRIRLDATGRRAAAYDRLSITETEREAMEWACARRGIAALAALRPLFDEAESMTDQDVPAWLESPLFGEESASNMATGLAEAVRLHAKWKKQDRFAARAENATIWFLRIAVMGMILVLLVGLFMRSPPSARARLNLYRWPDVQGPVNAEQRFGTAFSEIECAMQSATGLHHDCIRPAPG